jgi:ABC-type Zn2+ transport system substrate-binding protein/surface adhesin
VENPYAGQGSVLLDIGGDIGAVVVTMPASMDGEEIEIRPVGAVDADRGQAHESSHDQDHQHAHDHTHEHSHGDPLAQSPSHSPWPHVAVVARPTPSGMVPSLVFSEVSEGRYELYVRPHGAVQLTLDVVGGEVTQAAWPG